MNKLHVQQTINNFETIIASLDKKSMGFMLARIPKKIEKIIGN